MFPTSTAKELKQNRQLHPNLKIYFFNVVKRKQTSNNGVYAEFF